MRKNVYPKWVASGRMKQAAADHEIAAMTAALHSLMGLDAMRKALKAHHAWHLESGCILKLPDGQGGWIEIDNAAEYSDSGLCEQTVSVLAGAP